MNQSELIEKVAQTTELNQAAAGQAVKAEVNTILDALVAGEAVRVSGLGIFNVALRPAREGRNPRIHEPERASKSRPARRCDSTQARPSKMPSIHRLRRRPPGRSLYHRRNPRCGSKRPLAVQEGRDRGKCFVHSPDIRQADEETIAYWASRAGARYADLVWDFTGIVTKRRPDVSFARTTIDAYVEAIENKIYFHDPQAEDFAIRALGLAQSINDKSRIDKVKDILFTLDVEIGDVKNRGLSWILFDTTRAE